MGRKLRGVTLIEVLVTITVIAVMIALLLPALQAVREAARRAQCISNLRQLGLATQRYCGDQGTYPYGRGVFGQSLHVAILPYVEELNLNNSFNWSVQTALRSGSNGVSQPDFTAAVNRTAMHGRPNLFLCPSDPPSASSLAGDPWGQSTNYAGNYGSVYPGDPDADGPIQLLLVYPTQKAERDLVDGLSQTALLSEISSSTSAASHLISKKVFRRSVLRNDSLDAFASRCASRSEMRELQQQRRGIPWHSGDWPNNLYDHGVPPNLPICFRGLGSSASQFGQMASSSAGSMHPGGANVTFADGHVKFVKDTISPAVWRALGSTNGRELVSLTDL